MESSVTTLRVGAETSAVVGNTPLVSLPRLGADAAGEVVAKVEYFNPGGSVKDRIGVAMIDAAEREGLIERGRSVIVEPTSGNTGIALALVCAARDYRLILTLPEGMSRERTALLRTYGAEVHETPSLGGMHEAVQLAEDLVREHDGFMPQQFSNPANPEIHRRTTAEEIWRDLDGQVDAFVSGVGTGGTITGVARYLREQNPDVEVIGADPVGSIYSNDEVHPYLVEGVGEDFWPETFDASVVDRYVTVSDRDSFLTTRRLAAEEGLLVGGSCGLAVHAALEVAKSVDDAGAMVATILPDGGRAYLSKIFNDAWMRQYGFLERSSDRTVGDVLREKTAAGEIPPFVTVQTHQKVKDAISLLHEHRVSQLPVVSGTDITAVVGSVGERGLLKRAIDNPGLMNSDIVAVMEPPFPAVATGDPVREAVELLSGDRQALTVTEDGRPVGIVTRADLLESLVS
jgi:cystathionine beta-synthase